MGEQRKPKVGDTVTVRGVVRHYQDHIGTNSDYDYLQVELPNKRVLSFRADDIASVEPRPFVVGDRVTWHNCTYPGRIAASEKGLAWVLDAGRGYLTIPLANLRHVEESGS